MSVTEPVPRFLLRRTFAFLVDQLIAWALVFGLVQLSGRDHLNNMFKPWGTGDAFSRSLGVSLNASTEQFFAPISIVTTSCGEVGTIDQGIIDHFAPRQITYATACWPRIFGLPRSGTLEATLKDSATGGVTKETIEIHSNDPIIAYQDGVALALFIALSAVCGGLIGTTPGKFIAGLRLQGASLRVTLQRELLRSLPWICSVGQLYLRSWLPAHQIGSLEAERNFIYGIWGIGALAILVLWILPQVRWRGAMTYDWVAGIAVVRAAAPAAGV